MRILVLFLGFIISVLPVFSQRNIDIIHYRFQLSLNDSNDSIKGQAELLGVFLKPGNEIMLDLVQAKKGTGQKGMLVTNVVGAGVKEFRHTIDKLLVKFNTTAAVNDSFRVNINYQGIPADGLIISNNKFGNRGFFADNWPNRGHHWLPCIDEPADKASVEFIVIAPQHYEVVANGLELSRISLPGNKTLTHYKEEVPISTKIMVIGVSDFSVQLSGLVNGCIPVYSWVYPEDAKNGFYDYALAAEILPYFIRKIGPYPYKKLANVQSKTSFGGLENANTIFYSEASVTGTRAGEATIAHEISHQWFGNMATEKSFSHLWLSEGLATYLTILYMEDKYGKDTAKAMLIEDRAEILEFAKQNSTAVVDNNPIYMELLNANSYEKGGFALHMLRRELGDSLFWKGIREYYNTYAGTVADTEDFRKVFEKVSGRDLKLFFEQWLYQAGHPQLDIGWTYNPNAKKVMIVIKQGKKIFDFPIELAARDAKGKLTTIKVRVNQPTLTVSIGVNEKPSAVIVDPNVNLLYEGKIKEMK